MGYIAGTLSTNEEILIIPKLHWCNYIRAILSSFVALFLLIILAMVPEGKINLYVTEPILLGALLITLGYAFIDVLRNKSIELACTNKRVIQKRGIIKRISDELQVSKVESLEVRQTMMGRILGYGNLHFSGTGTSKADFIKIRDPLTIKSLAADILEKHKH